MRQHDNSLKTFTTSIKVYLVFSFENQLIDAGHFKKPPEGKRVKQIEIEVKNTIHL